jgi:Helix-turn-helix domain
MLPDCPIMRGRLLRAARTLLDWSQARLAHEAGVSTATVHTLEAGRCDGRRRAVAVLVEALEHGGVRFVTAAGTHGEGVCFARLELARQPVRGAHLRLVSGNLRPASPGEGNRSPGTSFTANTAPWLVGVDDRIAAAELRVVCQRALVERLGRAGRDIGMARGLLCVMERGLSLMRANRRLRVRTAEVGRAA